LYKLNESRHVRDRKFEIILQVNPVEGTLLTGGHPGCVDEIVRVNLREAVKEGRPVLSGVVQYGQWVDAWMGTEDSIHSVKTRSVLYEGHVSVETSDEDAEKALNRLATNLGRYLKSPKIRVALGENFWVFSLEEEQLAATA
jgi:hypothetical protein